MKTSHKYIVWAILAATATFAAVLFAPNSKSANEPTARDTSSDRSAPSNTNTTAGQVAGASTVKPAPQLVMPISFGLTRVTKKPFGLKITPETSPVENDIFSGYHTGIDFETFATEQDKDVTIVAACDGKVLMSTWAKGYGGLVVESCKLYGQDVTVIYGHVKLEGLKVKVGQTLIAGDEIGFLGQGFTHETDGRRKHLHFDIHKGTETNVLGYVPKQDDLADWIDPVKYLQ